MLASLLHVLFVLPLLLATSVAASQDTCAVPIRDDCSFYPRCVESLYDCKSSGYPIGYGYKYCNAFQLAASQGKFSEKGKKWVSDVMYCLQAALEPYLTQEQVHSMSCDQLKKTAFGTHAKCYVDSGVCSLPPTDWLEILHTIGPQTLAMEDTLMQGLKTVELCIAKGPVTCASEVGMN